MVPAAASCSICSRGSSLQQQIMPIACGIALHLQLTQRHLAAAPCNCASQQWLVVAVPGGSLRNRRVVAYGDDSRWRLLSGLWRWVAVACDDYSYGVTLPAAACFSGLSQCWLVLRLRLAPKDYGSVTGRHLSLL